MGALRGKSKSRSKAIKPRSMGFEYSCFISYRHGEGEVLQGFIEQLITALDNEVELHSPLKVFVDKRRFSAGTKLNASIAEALCKSVCMILVYTPRYFAEDSNYCTQEFLAMQELESIRAKKIPSRTKGPIIPVILRGKSGFPKNIFTENENVIYCDFEEFDLTNKRILKNPKFYKKIKKEIASHIVGKINESAGRDLCEDCNQFELPSENTARAWRKKTLKKNGGEFPFDK